MRAELSPQQQTAVSYSVLTLALVAVAYGTLATPLRERTAFFSSLDTQRTTYAKSTAALARSNAVSAEFERRRGVVVTDQGVVIVSKAEPAEAFQTPNPLPN